MFTNKQHFILILEERDKLETERDRRYAEVSVEKEKALRIKEAADFAALQLAREIQTYKDEKANELREQISSERGFYASKDDLSNVAEKLEATIKPISEFMTSQQGRYGGGRDSKLNMSYVYSAIIALTAVVSLIIILFHK